MRAIKSAVAMMVCCMLFGCTNNNSNETVGAVSGAVAGGLLGSVVGGGTGQVIAVGVGALAGALLGEDIGRSMDETDHSRIHDAMDNNVTSQPAHWTNEATGGEYMVVPQSGWMKVEGYDHCRRYASSAFIGGVKRNIHGVACRQPDGSWQAVSQ